VADRLYRSRDDRVIAGVAGGVAELLDADPSIIRVVWALLIFLTGGLALIVYIVMAIVVPERPDRVGGGPSVASTGGAAAGGTGAASWPRGPAEEGSWVAPDGSHVPSAAGPPAGASRRRGSRDRAGGGLVAGILLILIGGFLLIRQLVPSIDLGFWWPTVAIGLGIVLVVLALLPSRRSD
jgi:phage shock protein PspC (stress-responsive transcriptional regulator)